MELSGRNCPGTFCWGDKTESRDNQPRDCISPSSHAPSLTSKVVTSAHTLFSLGSKRESCSQLCPLGKSDWYAQEDGGKDHNVCSFSDWSLPTHSSLWLHFHEASRAGWGPVFWSLMSPWVWWGVRAETPFPVGSSPDPQVQLKVLPSPQVQAVFSSPALAWPIPPDWSAHLSTDSEPRAEEPWVWPACLRCQQLEEMCLEKNSPLRFSVHHEELASILITLS